jgi:hypothetical protein
MERTEDLIDLGAATVETKGPIGQGFDEVLARRLAGLSDD